MLVAGGRAGLTMRELAERLGVQPNTLYSYTESKRSLIDEVLDDVLGDVAAPGPDDDPRAALFTIMESTYDVLVAHRSLVPLYVEQQGARGPNAHRLGGIMINHLHRAGVDGAVALEARHVLIVYTIGSAAYYTGAPIATYNHRIGADSQQPEAFLTGLRWLLDGIGRITE